METIFEITKAILAAIGCGVVWVMAIIVIAILAGLIPASEQAHGRRKSVAPVQPTKLPEVSAPLPPPGGITLLSELDVELGFPPGTVADWVERNPPR